MENSRIYDEMLTKYIDQAQSEAANRLLDRCLSASDAALIRQMLGLEPDGQN